VVEQDGQAVAHLVGIEPQTSSYWACWGLPTRLRLPRRRFCCIDHRIKH